MCGKTTQPVIFLSDTKSLSEDRWATVRIFAGRTSVSATEVHLLVQILFSVTLESRRLCSGMGNAVDTSKRRHTFTDLLFVTNSSKTGKISNIGADAAALTQDKCWMSRGEGMPQEWVINLNLNLRRILSRPTNLTRFCWSKFEPTVIPLLSF